MKSMVIPILVAALAVPVTATPSSDRTAVSHRVVQEGIAIDVSLDPLAPSAAGRLREGDDVRVRIAVTDTHTGAPMSTLYPAAWINRLPKDAEDDLEACQSKVEGFLSGSLLSVPDLDLNVYYVLTMNHDDTLSVVDPLFGFGGSKLLTLVLLESPGEDWALTRDQKRLFVSMPRSGKIAVIDTATWKVIRNVEVGALPTRVALQDDERYLWVAWEGQDDGVSGVSVVDTVSLSEKARLETGRGRHAIAFDERGRSAFVSNEIDGTVSVVDIRRLAVLENVDVGGQPLSLDYSGIGRAVFVADAANGRVTVIDGEKHEVVRRLTTDPGIARIRFSPDGRWGFIPNPQSHQLHIVDAATRSILQHGEMEKHPDDVAFSDTLAYVRHRGSDLLLMIPLDEIGQEGAPIPVIDVPGGNHPAGDTPMPSSADTIVQAPGANAVLIANPQDKAVYFYKEGMAAPMGHFQNYGRNPRAVTVVDRSLQEVSPGIYETTVKMRGRGRYDLAIFVDSPRVIHCFETEILPNAEIARKAAESRRLVVELTAGTRRPAVGETVKLQVAVRDAKTGEPRDALKDVDVVAFLAPGIWQRRQWARHLGDGLYEVELTPPKAGIYYVFVEIPSERLRSNQSPSLVLDARETPPKAEISAP